MCLSGIGQGLDTEEVHQGWGGHLPETREIVQGRQALGIVVFDLIGDPDELVQLIGGDRFRLPLGHQFVEAKLKLRREAGVNLAQQRRLLLTEMGRIPLGTQGDHLSNKGIQCLRWQSLDRAQELLG